MTENTRDDIRRLLKTFGIQADETIMAHLDRSPGVSELHVRITLTDLTDYGGEPPDRPLEVTVEGTIRTGD